MFFTISHSQFNNGVIELELVNFINGSGLWAGLAKFLLL